MPSGTQTVSVIYTQILYTLSVTKGSNGSGTVTSSPVGINCGTACAYDYVPATVVVLSPVASTGSSFAGWSGACTNPTGTCSVTMNAAAAVTANFTLNTYNLTVNKVGTGSGTVTSSPSGINCGSTCVYAFNYNQLVVLSAANASGSSFTGWSGSGCSGTGTCSVTITAVAAVTATFTLNEFSPVATNDSYTTLKNTSMTIVAPGVMANDTDANGDTLTAVLDSGLSNGGSLTFNSDGSFTYNPPTGYTGTDTFYYHDNDGHVNGNIATVTLNVIDSLPPSQPSSFYGTINYYAPPQPVGLTVEAYVPGVATPVATTTIQGGSR